MEAETIVGKTAGPAKPSRYRIYEPRTFNERTPGLEKTRGGLPWTDAYFGTGEAIVSSGLAEWAMLPGSPGVGALSARYRPAGTPVLDSCITPGYISIFGLPGGRFRVELTVSREEQAHRKTAFADASRVAATSPPVRPLQPESATQRPPRAIPAGWRVIAGGA